MRLTLIDSARPLRAPSALGPVLSVAVHLAFVAAVSLQPGLEERMQAIDEPLPEGLTFLVPPASAPESPVTELQYQEDGGGKGIPEGVKVEEEGNQLAEERGGRDSLSSGDVAQNDNPDPSQAFASPATIPADVFMKVEVDSAAVQDPTSIAPAYPPEMQAQRIEGYVAVRFVVDTAGRVDLTTVQVMLASRPEFARAVRAALPGMKFTPARVGTTPVRQLAEQMFRFQLPRPGVVRPPGA